MKSRIGKKKFLRNIRGAKVTELPPVEAMSHSADLNTTLSNKYIFVTKSFF